jgi:hypothetical protein
MEHVFLIWTGGTAEREPTDAERHASHAAHGAFAQQLAERGAMRYGAPLQGADTALVVSLKGDERIVTDGPFIETKEQLGGFYVADCANLDEALNVARMIPLLPGEAVEVRATADMAPPQG